MQKKLEHELWQLAQETLRLGLGVVLDFGLWARTERDEMRSVARGLGVGVELHYLDVPSNELWRRMMNGTRSPLGRLPNPPRRPRRVAHHLLSARCCRAGLV